MLSLKAPYADPSEAAPIIPRIQKLLGLARRLRMAVIYTVVSNEPRLPEASVVRRMKGLEAADRLQEGTPGVEVIKELAPEPGDLIIRKVSYSAFYETGLERKLRSLGIQYLVICGGQTNWGVEAMARDAEYRDFVPIVLSDATVGTNPQLHAATLANVELFIGFVITCEQVIAALSGGAD